MSGRPPRVVLSAGEASGDRLGAGLAEALARRLPGVELAGMGGPQMRRAGVRVVQDASEVAVVGILEVLPRLPAIRRAMSRLSRVLDDEAPDLFVPIDFPDFNLRLAARAHGRGIPVVYFVSPQVWAWRRRRVARMRTLVRRMLVLFPFEVQFYERAGVPVSFVGHPAVDGGTARRPASELCAAAGLDPARPVLALAPGSREGEAARLLPPMLEAAALLRRERPELQLLVTRAPSVPAERVGTWIAASGLAGVRVHSGDFPAILSVCAAGVVASGTASLEAALEGLPIVVVYRMSPLTYAIGRALVDLDDVALPNLVAGRRIVPELIQGECTPERIAQELARYLDDASEAERTRRALAELRPRLGGPGVFERAADALVAELAALGRGS